MALEHLYLEVSDIQAGPGAREKRCFCFFVETFLLSVLPCFVCVCAQCALRQARHHAARVPCVRSPDRGVHFFSAGSVSSEGTVMLTSYIHFLEASGFTSSNRYVKQVVFPLGFVCSYRLVSSSPGCALRPGWRGRLKSSPGSYTPVDGFKPFRPDRHDS